jgi:hypothetical protein
MFEDVRDNEKWFMQMKSVNHFTFHECYFSWSVENIFKLANTLYRTKHSKIKKTLFRKYVTWGKKKKKEKERKMMNTLNHYNYR